MLALRLVGEVTQVGVDPNAPIHEVALDRFLPDAFFVGLVELGALQRYELLVGGAPDREMCSRALSGAGRSGEDSTQLRAVRYRRSMAQSSPEPGWYGVVTGVGRQVVVLL